MSNTLKITTIQPLTIDLEDSSPARVHSLEERGGVKRDVLPRSLFRQAARSDYQRQRPGGLPVSTVEASLAEIIFGSNGTDDGDFGGTASEPVTFLPGVGVHASAAQRYIEAEVDDLTGEEHPVPGVISAFVMERGATLNREVLRAKWGPLASLKPGAPVPEEIRRALNVVLDSVIMAVGIKAHGLELSIPYPELILAEEGEGETPSVFNEPVGAAEGGGYSRPAVQRLLDRTGGSQQADERLIGFTGMARLGPLGGYGGKLVTYPELRERIVDWVLA